eukprot:6250630-Pyramimonas_sp.AAC.1
MRPPRWLETAQEAPETAPRGPQDGPRGLQDAQDGPPRRPWGTPGAVSYTHLRAHETGAYP